MNVLFVVMPFGSIRPNIGVSLLKSHLARIGVVGKVLYLNMRYAHLVGATPYDAISENSLPQSLAGDWVFRSCLYRAQDSADDNYLAEFEERFSIADNPEFSRRSLEDCRAIADSFLRDCLDEVDWQSYDVVGFTSTFAQHVASLALAKLVKDHHPKVRVVFGGANCESTMGLQTHRSFPFIDFVCSGEGDRSFPQLVEALRADRPVDSIGGIIWRRHGNSCFASLTPQSETDMDTLPTPDYSDYFEQFKQFDLSPPNGGGVPMESSRGCWWGQKHHCTFCGLNGGTMAFRSKSGRRVMEELGELCERYRQREFAMVDNIFDMKYFRDLLPTLQKRQIKLTLFYETKANLTKCQLRNMKDAGVEAIQPGIESLNSNVLRLMRKGTTALQNIQLLKWCKEIGIVPHWNLLYGFPGELSSDYEEMTRTIRALHHLQPPSGIARIRLDRYSPNFFDGANLGLIRIRPDRAYSFVYALPDRDIAEIAYFFDYDYADGRVPETYIGPAREAVVQWQTNHPNRGLHCVDHGDRLAIWDFRPHAARMVTVLSSRDRAVYLYCDQHRSLQQILALPEVDDQASSVVPVLSEWIGNRIMIGLDGQYLALAVQVGTPATSGSAQGAEVLQTE